MKFVLKMLDRLRPAFEKGRPAHFLQPLFEAVDTFAFTPPTVTPGPPHIRDALDIKRVMMFVVVALIPCTLMGIYNAGFQHHLAMGAKDVGAVRHFLEGLKIVLPIILVSYVVGGFWEVLFALVRRREINEGFLVTGLLFPLTLPPSIPLWQVALGITFGVVIGKEIFGGTGFNVWNPALTARAFLYFAYPAQISGDRVWVAVRDWGSVADGFTGATAMAVTKSAPPGVDLLEYLHSAGVSLRSIVVGLEPGSIGETSAIAVALGLAVLLVTGIASWKIIVGGILGVAAMGTAFKFLPSRLLLAHPQLQLPFYYDLAMGGVFFGIVFMATDPVSAAATSAGKWIYGFLIGALTSLLRAVNPAYPATNMMVILFCNTLAPLIDHLVVQTHIVQRQSYLKRMNRG